MAKHTQIVIIGLVRHKGKYLLTKRKEFRSKFHDLWQLPGGGLEWGERVEECLKRELQEELGMKVKNIKYIPFIYQETRKNWHGVFFNFLCEPVEKNPHITLNDEASEYGWFTLEEVKKLKRLPGTAEIIEKALAK